MRAVDMFAGIGGVSLAMNMSDIEVVGHVEIDTFCQQVLLKHWPSVPIYSDIFDIKGDEFGKYELLHASFPCQPFSVAGTKRGTEDRRYLWPQVLRIIDNVHPLWITGENVKGIVNVALEDILVSLEERDYEAWAYIWSAAAVGASHERNRVFIVAHANSNRCRTNRKKIWRKNREYGMGRAHDKFFIETNSMRTCITREDYQDRICRTNDGISSQLDKVRWPGLKGEIDVNTVLTYSSYDKRRLKALGNAVVPYQMIPLFTCMRQIQEMIDNG